MIDSLIVLGGGQAGLISALIMKAARPKLKITIIKSDDIGTIGVGEGSTEHWSTFCRRCNIDTKELVEQTDATYKLGVKFTNWNGDGKHYFHFLMDGRHNKHPNQLYELGVATDYIDGHCAAPEWLENNEFVLPMQEDWSINQFHFEANKLNRYLLNLCRRRDINIITDKINQVGLDEQGYIDHLVGDVTYKADFFIDCSGFKRVMGSEVGIKWVDRGHHLPVNHAIAFPTEYEEDIPAYSECKAMKHGWMWKLPTYNRNGNGYVFGDDFATTDQVIEEVETLWGEKINIARDIKFRAGHSDNYWMKNVVVAGLSGSFVEPLEASSIGSTIQQMILLQQSLSIWERGSDFVSKKYNQQISQIVDNVVDFVQLHYITKRTDTEFWRQEIQLTDFNKEALPFFRKQLPHQILLAYDNPYFLYNSSNFAQVLTGLEITDRSAVEKYVKTYYNDEYKMHSIATQHSINLDAMSETVSHRDFLGLTTNADV